MKIRSEMWHRHSCLCAIALLVALLAIAYGDILLLGRGFYISDVGVYHYPMKHVVREAVRRGEFPYWNRLYSGGAPLAANPAYELFYPPQWLVYVLPFHFGVQLHILLHFAIAMIGMFVLLRRLETSIAAAAFGSIALVFCGSYVSLSSKLPILFSISWLPLALWLLMRFVDERTAARLLPLAAVLAMQWILGEPAGAMQTWAIIAGWALLRIVRKSDNVKRIAATLGIAIGSSLLLAAVQLLAAIDFVRDTVRTKTFDFRVVANWSTPPIRFVELILPGVLRHITGANGHALITTIYPFRADAYLTEVYAGLLVVLLALAGIFAGVRGRWLFLGTAAASVIVAMGDHTPLLQMLYDTHLFSAIRFPEKFLLTAAFAIAVWSAIVFDRLLAGDRGVIRWTFALAVVWLIISIILLLNFDDRRYFVINCIRAAIVAAFVWLMRTRRSHAIAIAGIALLAADLWYGTLNAVPRAPREFFDSPPLLAPIDASQPYRVFNEVAWQGWEGDPVVNQLFDVPPGPQLWWLMRNSAFPEMPAAHGLPLAMEDDIDLTSLTNTDDFREAFKGARSTHLPDADAPYARMSNVGWRVRLRPVFDASTNPNPVEIVPVPRIERYSFAGRLERVPDPGGFRYAVERNAADSSVAYIAAEPFAPAPARVTRVRETANTATMDVVSTGRAFLVASVTGHRYWSATIDGESAPLIATNIAYQGLVVPPGTHTIAMRYRNPFVPIGGAISVIALAAFAVASRMQRTERRLSPPPDTFAAKRSSSA
jgi:predicted nucleic acid-binding protein